MVSMSKTTQHRNHNYNISPTSPLKSLHLKGLVTRRFLVSYPVPPEALSRFLPPQAELSTSQGFGWVSACFVNVKHMHPSFVPGALGIEFNYLVHRTRARLPYPDGAKRESVLVLEANINNSLFAAIGRRTSGVRFRPRDIRLTEGPDSWRLHMRGKSGVLLYSAEIPKASIGGELPETSLFPNLEAADKFLLGVPYGGEWHEREGKLLLLAETHDPWKALVGSCTAESNLFLKSIYPAPVRADHVITMTNVPHYFALFGSKISL